MGYILMCEAIWLDKKIEIKNLFNKDKCLTRNFIDNLYFIILKYVNKKQNLNVKLYIPEGKEIIEYSDIKFRIKKQLPYAGAGE